MFVHILLKDIVARTLARPPRAPVERPARTAKPIEHRPDGAAVEASSKP